MRFRMNAVCLALGSVALVGLAVADDKNGPVKIGMVDSFYRDTPEKTVQASAEPFRAIMKAQTGRGGDIIRVDGVETLGRMLDSGEMELGVFHGIEFAWAQQKYPKLAALVIAVNQNRNLTAHLLVSQGNSASSLSDLKGKAIALPAHSKEHCRLYLGRHPSLGGQESKQFFSQTTEPPNIEDALDDVVDGVVVATLVDGVGLERYKARKPARFAKLKEIEKSAVFPTSVVAYREGMVSDKTQEQFRKALLTAGDSADGQQLLTMWKLTGFERVPEDFQALLEEAGKKYPAKSAP